MLWDIKGLFGLGGLLLLFGVVIMVVAWPEVTTSVGYASLGIEPTVTESGSEAGVFFGGVLAALGQTMLAIAVIAVGVRVGINESRATTGS